MSERPDRLNAADTPPDGGGAESARWVRKPEGEDPREIDREMSDSDVAEAISRDRHVSHAEKNPVGHDPSARDQDPDG